MMPLATRPIRLFILLVWVCVWSSAIFVYHYGSPSSLGVKLPEWSLSKITECTSVPVVNDTEVDDPGPPPPYIADEFFDVPNAHAPGFPHSADNDDEVVVPSTHHVVYSASTPDRKHFDIRMGRFTAYNPSIIPHPTNTSRYIIVAQHEKSAARDPVFAQLACNAAFVKGELVCQEVPVIVPYAGTNRSPLDIKDGKKCAPKYQYLNGNVGPHDARVFWGPNAPYTVFGSNSHHICFGMWIQDFRRLYGPWGVDLGPVVFQDEAELLRPDPPKPNPYYVVEKNYFVFWDLDNKPYVHHDIWPARTFAALSMDGTAGPNLAPAAVTTDTKCLAKYMPKPARDLEGLHQATNSISVTMCKRGACEPDETNTFVVAIVQLKTFYGWHAGYEPYVVLLKRRAPFELHAISKTALWIHGRAAWNAKAAGKVHKWKEFRQDQLIKNHAEFFYVTSLTWKGHEMKYHGYLDDVLFLGIGIEDARAAAIDVVAGDILQNLGVCGDL